MKPASTQSVQAAISRCTASSATCAWLVSGVRFRVGESEIETLIEVMGFT
jgi:hypothetical protein